MTDQSSNLTQSNRTDTAIHVEELTKYYGDIVGISNVTFSIKRGEIHGFLGPNGAGKTTTIRILVGLMGATKGQATINGEPVGSLSAKKLVGYLPSDFGLPKHLNVNQYLDYIEQLRGKAPYREELINRMDLDITRKTAELSKGNRQKVCIVQALMHEPEILIADEPTSGLDPLMQAEFNRYLKEYVDRGGTVFVSSHILADIQTVCDNITVIRRGKIVSSGSINELLANMPRKIIVTLKSDENIDVIAQKLDATVGEHEFDKYALYFDGSSKEAAKILIDLDEVEDFTIPNPSLEEYFMQIYNGENQRLSLEEKR